MSPSNLIKINGATTHEKKTIEPASMDVIVRPKRYKISSNIIIRTFTVFEFDVYFKFFRRILFIWLSRIHYIDRVTEGTIFCEEQ